MAVYCIGDLHGRFDLFTMCLKKIQFKPQIDKLYILGDVIDYNYGGIKILNYVREHQNSCFLIKGNHEHNFLNFCDCYDLIMSNEVIKSAMLRTIDIYSSKLFDEISSVFSRNFSKKDNEAFYKQPAIKKWLSNGNKTKRNQLLESMIRLAESTEYNKKTFQQIESLLRNSKTQFNTKELIRELLEQSEDTYLQIKEFVEHLPECYRFNYANTQFVLKHQKGALDIYFPHAKSYNTTYIFGHIPVAFLHSLIQSHIKRFDFDYRHVFSWIDINLNRYYWLDLASNPIVALKLDDMSEYYVGLPSDNWVVPNDYSPKMGITYTHVENARLGNIAFKNSAILSLNNGCYEFLIGICPYSKCIYYTHIGWMECNIVLSISDLSNENTIEKIIDQVRADFEEKRKLPEYAWTYTFLRGRQYTYI